VRIQGTSFRGLSAHSRKASAYVYTAIIQTNIDTTVMALHCPRITCHAPDGHRNELLQTFVSRADEHNLTPVVQFKVAFLCLYLYVARYLHCDSEPHVTLHGGM
jgi:hypothetical protein